MYRSPLVRLLLTLCALCLCILPLREPYKAALSGAGQKRMVYLTFDDGPSSVTDAVLDILLVENVRATFFVVGVETEQGLACYTRILEEGHALGLHAYDHTPYRLYSSLASYQRDFARLDEWIAGHADARVRICRMVGGSNSSECPAIVREEILTWLVESGYACYDWDIDAKDSGAYAISAKQLAQNVISAAKKLPNRDLIVLMHDDAVRKTLPEALPSIIRYFQEHDFGFGVLREDTESIKRILPKKYRS